MAETHINKLKDKVAIVTGGASGIGEATALQFASHGARTVVIADVDDQKGHDVAASIGPQSSYIRCDVSEEDQVKSLVDSTIQIHFRLDIIFSNAGVFSSSEQTVIGFDISNYERLMVINVRGSAACVKHAARVMVEGGAKGTVICTASILAEIGVVWFTDYTMSKHTILGLMRLASIQLDSYGICVNCVSPGPCATPLLGLVLAYNNVEEKSEFTTAIEQKIMSPEHVAKAVVYLTSGDSICNGSQPGRKW